MRAITAGPSPAIIPSAEGADDPKLRQAARQLTGVFAQQLFKAMRDTVPQDQGVVSGGSGEEMFTGMLDEHLAGAGPGAASARESFTQGLADAVYRRLRAQTAPAAHPAAPAAVTPAPAPASLAQSPAPLGPVDRR